MKGAGAPSPFSADEVKLGLPHRVDPESVETDPCYE